VLLGESAHGKNVIHVSLLRGDRPIDLTLEIPLDEQGAAPGEADADGRGDAASDAGKKDAEAEDARPEAGRAAEAGPGGDR
jgi:hypothetical protein